jgi:hypothetical protein
MHLSSATSYILPIKAFVLDASDELTEYLTSLQQFSNLELIVVDASPDAIFDEHWRRFGTIVRHVRPDPLTCLNGKVRGVLTGLRMATNEKVIIADDDIRYDPDSLNKVVRALDTADVVRPQNYFSPHTWHTIYDSSRSLLNRVSGGDWPGTLAIRKKLVPFGYNGDVLFENLELVRTIRANGGRELVALDIYVRRLPPSPQHFFGQRIRQAYDEFARPWRMMLMLITLPVILLGACAAARAQLLGVPAAIAIASAEAGRLRGGAHAYFSFLSSLLAPLWILERAVCVWLAAAMRLCVGGIKYSGTRVVNGATPMRVLANVRSCQRLS